MTDDAARFENPDGVHAPVGYTHLVVTPPGSSGRSSGPEIEAALVPAG